MSSQVGQRLRAARTKQGIELTEVERVTKIREKFLRAMEENRWEAMPAPAYAEGFLDIYARFLGLDHKELLQEYRQGAEDSAPEAVPPGAVQAGVRTRTQARRSGVFTHTRARHAPPVKPVVLFVAGLAAVAVLGAVIVDAISGSDNGGGAAAEHHRQKATPGPTATEAGAVSLELRPTADVWVCAVDDRDRTVVNGETLTAGEVRGPFQGRAFELTFGNGSIEMSVDGEPTKVPAVAEPISYRVTPSGVNRLDTASGPSCL
jgi:hypothetical protein